MTSRIWHARDPGPAARLATCFAVVLLGAVACPAASCRAEAAAEGAAAPQPRLVLLVAVDQLRRDRIDASLPGGLGRLVREGRVYVEAALDHGATETCPGHATMLSGRHPGPMGVPGNQWIDRATGERIYCVEDRSGSGVVFGGSADPTDGRSPRLLRAGGLGGWMKAAQPSTRVFSVSGKDRSAVAMTGADADAAYWIAKQAGTGFTTSHYYEAELPSWVDAWNAGFAASLPDVWAHAPDGTGLRTVARPDDFAGESDDHSRTSPHPLSDPDREQAMEQIWVSPYLDELTLSFARALVTREGLGGGASPDLLALSLTATDSVGHEYGPSSAEARDALARLDAGLAEFLDFLEQRFGADRVLVVLTADHGVLPLPEWLAATGREICPVAGGRQGIGGLGARLFLEMHFELSPFSWPGSWLDVSGQLTVNRARAAEQGIAVAEAIGVAERFLEAEPVIREAWTAAEIRDGTGPIAALYRNSFDPERSGDLEVQLEPGCLIDYSGTGTSHVSPYEYDRNVPIVFFGPGVAPGRIPGRAATIDIAPTLAGLLRLAVPTGLDGIDLHAGEPGAPTAQPFAEREPRAVPNPYDSL